MTSPHTVSWCPVGRCAATAGAQDTCHSQELVLGWRGTQLQPVLGTRGPVRPTSTVNADSRLLGVTSASLKLIYAGLVAIFVVNTAVCNIISFICLQVRHCLFANFTGRWCSFCCRIYSRVRRYALPCNNLSDYRVKVNIVEPVYHG